MISPTIKVLEKFNKEVNVERFMDAMIRNTNLENLGYESDRGAEFGKIVLKAVKESSKLNAQAIEIEKIFNKEYKANGEKFLENLNNIFMSSYQIKMWLEWKEIYKFDNDTFEMLIGQEVKDMSYAELKALKLPFNSFAIENKMMVEVENENFDVIENKEIVTTIVSRKICKNGDLAFGFYSFIDEDASIYSVDFLVKENETLFEAIEKRENERSKKHILKFMNLLLYLSQPKIEIFRKGASLSNPNKKEKKVKSFYGISYHENEVGVRLGNAIRNYKIVYEKAKNEKDPSDPKRVVRPHVRSGHFQRYWVGKGRTDLITKYIEPTFVLGGSKFATIHNVKKG